MKCYKCDGNYRETTELLKINDAYVGQIIINGVPYYKCDKCNDLLFTEAMSQAINTKRNTMIQEFLQQCPIGDFISASETALILGISRQALHKNHRISHGFIYKTKLSGIIVYHKVSVNTYKYSGDGRFPIHFTFLYPQSISIITEDIYVNDLATVKKTSFQGQGESMKENVYAK